MLFDWIGLRGGVISQKAPPRYCTSKGNFFVDGQEASSPLTIWCAVHYQISCRYMIRGRRGLDDREDLFYVTFHLAGRRCNIWRRSRLNLFFLQPLSFAKTAQDSRSTDCTVNSLHWGLDLIKNDLISASWLRSLVLPWVEEARKCDGRSESDAQIGYCKIQGTISP